MANASSISSPASPSSSKAAIPKNPSISSPAIPSTRRSPIPGGSKTASTPGFADSPTGDPDSDGFSNLEEYTAKTDPNASKSHPPLIAKLKYLKDESLAWVLRPGYGDGGNFPFSYEDSKRRTNKVAAGGAIAPNGLFFEKDPMANRFKLLGSEVIKELNKKINIEVEVTVVRIEDLKSNKKGVIYQIPAALPEGRKNEFVQYDRSAVLSMEALGMAGTEFKVEENTTFSLPPNSPKKDYLLKTVTPQTIIVEYPDAAGTRKTVEIAKGTLPRLTD